MSDDWLFLIDECMEPRIARLLRKEDVTAKHVQEVPSLGKGADDFEDILPWTRREDAILVTNNFRDFDDVDFDDHAGILIDYDGRRSYREYAFAILRVVDRYPSRDDLRHREPLDDWL